jgi:hypothetical protein
VFRGSLRDQSIGIIMVSTPEINCKVYWAYAQDYNPLLVSVDLNKNVMRTCWYISTLLAWYEGLPPIKLTWAADSIHSSGQCIDFHPTRHFNNYLLTRNSPLNALGLWIEFTDDYTRIQLIPHRETKERINDQRSIKE